MTLWTLISNTSSRIDNGRSQEDILLHMMTEMGELAQEVIISEGRSYKEPGSDGVIGEAVDVILCAADLVIQRHPDITEEDLCETWFGGQGHTDLFGAMIGEARARDTVRDCLKHIYHDVGEISLSPITDARGIDPEHLDCISGPTMSAVMYCVRLIRKIDPEITAVGLFDIANPKLEKWEQITQSSNITSPDI